MSAPVLSDRVPRRLLNLTFKMTPPCPGAVLGEGPISCEEAGDPVSDEQAE